MIWLLAVVFAASPVALSIAFSPSHQIDLFDPASYKDLARDLVYLSVAIIAIGMIDALEVVASMLGEKPAKKWLVFVALVLIIALLPQLLFCAIWSAPSLHMSVSDVRTIPTILGSALVCAFGARLAAIMGAE